MSVRFTEVSLANVGVNILDYDRLTLQCQSCGEVFSLMLKSRSKRMPKGWWRCSKGCNSTLPRSELIRWRQERCWVGRNEQGDAIFKVIEWDKGGGFDLLVEDDGTWHHKDSFSTRYEAIASANSEWSGVEVNYPPATAAVEEPKTEEERAAEAEFIKQLRSLRDSDGNQQ